MISLLILIAIIGVIAWLLTAYVPMPPPIKTVIVIVAVIACVLIALRAFGIIPARFDTGVPQIRISD